MKLRIRGNSLRFRLSQVEVAALAGGQAVEEAVDLGDGQRFVYAVVPAPDAPSLATQAAPWRLALVVPSGLAREWHASAEVGFEATTASGCRLLLEKDFACVEPRSDEDQADAFPNPRATC